MSRSPAYKRKTSRSMTVRRERYTSSGWSSNVSRRSSLREASWAAWKPRSNSYRPCSTCSASRSLTSFWYLRLSSKRAARRSERGKLRSLDWLRSNRKAVEIGRPAVWSMSSTRKSTQPELSPRGAETSRSARPLKSTPAGTPVCLSNRSMRPWAEASKRPLPRTTRSKSSPTSRTFTSSCHPDDPSCGSISRTARSGLSVSP